MEKKRLRQCIQTYRRDILKQTNKEYWLTLHQAEEALLAVHVRLVRRPGAGVGRMTIASRTVPTRISKIFPFSHNCDGVFTFTT